MPMTEKKLLARDAKRDIGAELLASALEMKAGKKGRVHRISLSQVTQARAKSGLSQSQFARVLGVSPRTLQDWEQGRRKPSGAAQSLLSIAAKHPEVIREVLQVAA
jgi:putative transcriptional regulator